MATITNGKELRRLMRLGRDIIFANPLIAQGDFRAALERDTSFDRDDWDTVEAVLFELEYVADVNFSTTRVFWRGASDLQARVVRRQAEAFFPTSVAAQRASSTLARDNAVIERDNRRDLIRDHFTPFIDRPPVGVSAQVVDGLREHRNRIRAERQAFTRLIEQLDNTLAALP